MTTANNGGLTVEEWEKVHVSNAVDFGRNVRNLRKARGWTQADLSEQFRAFGLEVHQTTIAKMENATRPTTLWELWVLVSVFGVTYDELLPLVAPVSDKVTAAVRKRERAKENVARAHNAHLEAEAELRQAEQELAEVRGIKPRVATRGGGDDG